MSNTVIGASVNIEYQSIGEVRKAIKDATSDLLRMQEAFGKTSPQAMAAAKKVAELKDRIADAKEQADLFDPGNKFKAFSNAASQVAAGFSAVQGAMALVGSESDDLQKTLVKVQGAMALSQGLSQIGDLGKAFDELKIVGVRAFTALKAAIGSTGIGLLVIALGTIAVYWDDIKAAVSGVSEEQKKLNKQSQENLNTQKEKLDAISSQDNILKLQGKSERDILKLKIAQSGEAIKAAEINIQNSIETQKAQVEAAKRNKQILEGILKFISIPITTVLKGVDLIGKAVGKNLDLEKKFFGGVASLVFDPEETEEKGKADLKAQQKALDDLKNQRAGFQLQIQEMDKKDAEKRTQDAEKVAAERQKIIDEAIEAERKAFEELTKSRLSDREKELFELQKSYDEQKKIIEAGGQSTAALTELYEKQKADVEKKYKEERLKKEAEFQSVVKGLTDRLQQEAALSEQEAARKAVVDKYAKEREELMKQYPNNLALLILLKQNEQAELDKVDADFAQKKMQSDAAKLLQQSSNEELSFQERLAKIAEREQLESKITFKSEEERLAFQDANSKAKKAIIAAETQFRIDQAQKVSDVLNQLSDAVGKETAAGKVMAIAAATINTYLAASKALTGIKTGNPLGAAIAIAQTAAVIATGIKTVREIAKTKVPGGGGGSAPTAVAVSASAPMAPTVSPAVQGQALNAEAINNLGNQAARAYVLNSDIQNNEQRNAYLERNARIG